MSNVAPVTNDLVVASSGEVGIGSRAASSSGGAATLAFADSAPLVRVREELGIDAEGQDPMVAACCGEESPESAQDALAAFLGMTPESLGRAGDLADTSSAAQAGPRGGVAAVLKGDSELEPADGIGLVEALIAEMIGGEVPLADGSDVSQVTEPVEDALGALTDVNPGQGQEILSAGTAISSGLNGASYKTGSDSIPGLDHGESNLLPSPTQSETAAGGAGNVNGEMIPDGSGEGTSGPAAQTQSELLTAQTSEAVQNAEMSGSTQGAQVSDTTGPASSLTAVEVQQDARSAYVRQDSETGTVETQSGVEKTGQGDRVPLAIDSAGETTGNPAGSTAVVDSAASNGATAQVQNAAAAQAQPTSQADTPPAAEGGTGSAADSSRPMQGIDSDRGDIARQTDQESAQTPSVVGDPKMESPADWTVAQGQGGPIASQGRTSEMASQSSEQTSMAGTEEAAKVVSEVSGLPEDSAATHSMRSSETASSSAEATPFRSSAEDVGQQIVDSVQMSLRQGDKELVVRLNPPELGSVSVRLEEGPDGITGVLEVGKGETRREIEQALPQVVQSLQEAGVQVRRLDLTVTDQPDRDFGRDQLQQDGAGQHGANPDAEHSESRRGMPPSGAARFQQTVLGTSEGQEAPGGEWSRDGIDMLM